VAAGLEIGKLLDGGFTGRLGRKFLVTVDEAKEGAAGKKYQKADALKALITVEARELNPKYGVPSVQRNCARWLMLSNHEDALPLDRLDRRCVVIRNPDKPRDADYYSRIYAAIHNPRFIGAVWEYLRTLDISDFNAQRPAALSASKRAVIAAMESEVSKAIRQFFEDWPGKIVDRETLFNSVTDETGGRALHAKHFRDCLDEVGAVVRTEGPNKGRVKFAGKLRTIVGFGIDKTALDALTPSQITRLIREAEAAVKFAPDE
jgi:hypothetical protein